MDGIEAADVAVEVEEDVPQFNPYGIEPLGDRVLVERLPEPETMGANGIIVAPDNAKEKPCEGIVIATGPGRDLDNGYIIGLRVKPGDRIVFGRYAGVELPEEFGSKNLWMMRADEILAIRRSNGA